MFTQMNVSRWKSYRVSLFCYCPRFHPLWRQCLYHISSRVPDFPLTPDAASKNVLYSTIIGIISAITGVITQFYVNRKMAELANRKLLKSCEQGPAIFPFSNPTRTYPFPGCPFEIGSALLPNWHCSNVRHPAIEDKSDHSPPCRSSCRKIIASLCHEKILDNSGKPVSIRDYFFKNNGSVFRVLRIFRLPLVTKLR